MTNVTHVVTRVCMKCLLKTIGCKCNY